MIILLTGNATYKKGDDFPLLSIPVNMEGATNQSLKDFQWWAYSADFQKWLKANPREWVADSENTGKYRELSDIVNEAFSSYKHINSNVLRSGVRDYGSFLNEEMIFEADKDKDDAGPYIKLHYAYNKLIADGKLENEFVVADQKTGEDKAVFLCLKDNEGAEVMESLTAYRMSPVDTGSASKIRLFNVTERIVGGAIKDDENTEGLLEKAAKSAIKIAALSAVGIASYSLIKNAGTFFSVRAGLKGLSYLRDMKTGAKTAEEAAKAAKIMERAKRIAALKRASTAKGLAQKGVEGVKSIFGGAIDLATLKNTRTAAADFYGGVKWAQGLRSLKTGEKFVGMQALKNSLKYGAEGVEKGSAKLIPFVGEILMATEIVGSTWNWFSGNQAPRLGQVEDFAKDNFNPKEIPIGKPITICWSQPAGGGWGTAISFLFNNDTRTTMEVVKVMEKDNKSIFILCQINSKELQKQLADHEMTLLAFDNSHKFERGYLDNDDLEFEMLAVDGLSKIASTVIYEGSCNWNDLTDYYNKASDKLLVVDPAAPPDYLFYYDDGDGEMINVAGKLVTNEDLEKYGPSDMRRIFGIDLGKSEESKKNESISSFSWDKSLLEGESLVTKFSDFLDANESQIFEVESDESPTEVKPDKMSGPAKLAIYLVTEKDYANPELRGKYDTGEYTNFVVDDDDFKAPDDALISVELNTTEHLANTRRGIFTYKKVKVKEKGESKTREDKEDIDKTKDDGKDKSKETEKPETKKDDYYITTTPKDVSIKNRKSSSIIRDHDIKDGVNLFDRLLSTKQKEILGIQNWKTITFAKELLDNRGDVIEVRLKNKYSSFGDKSRRYRVVDGESFEIAKKFVEETKDRIKYR